MLVAKQRALERSSRHRLSAFIVVLAVTSSDGSSPVDIGNRSFSLYCTATRYHYSKCPCESIPEIVIVGPVRTAHCATECALLPCPPTRHLPSGML